MKSRPIKEKRLDDLESDFEPLLISCLRECAGGRWGLFGQNDASESPDIVSGMRQSSSKKLLTRFKSYGRSLVNQTQRFAKTPADREINNMAAAIPPPFCYKP